MSTQSVSGPESGRVNLLLHDFNVHFLHIHLLIELGRELGLPQQLLIYRVGHSEGCPELLK